MYRLVTSATTGERQRQGGGGGGGLRRIGVCKGVSSGGKWPRLPHRCSQTIPFHPFRRRRSLVPPLPHATTSSVGAFHHRPPLPLLPPSRHPPFLRFERAPPLYQSAPARRACIAPTTPARKQASKQPLSLCPCALLAIANGQTSLRFQEIDFRVSRNFRNPRSRGTYMYIR